MKLKKPKNMLKRPYNAMKAKRTKLSNAATKMFSNVSQPEQYGKAMNTAFKNTKVFGKGVGY